MRRLKFFIIGLLFVLCLLICNKVQAANYSIDYIDMKSEENRQKILEILKEELKKDRTKTQVIGFSKLNLLELTRKHICEN